MSIRDCYNIEDFKKLAKKNLPAPIFHYIDGGADDETTLKRNTDSFSKCDLIPNILASVGEPDLSVEVFGHKINMPLFCLQPQCKGYIITKETKHLQRRQKNLELFIACPLWQLHLLRK